MVEDRITWSMNVNEFNWKGNDLVSDFSLPYSNQLDRNIVDNSTTQSIYNRSNSFPMGPGTVNEESYFVDFSKFTNSMGTSISSVSESSPLNYDVFAPSEYDYLMNLTNSGIDKPIDDISKFQRSSTLDLSCFNLEYAYKHTKSTSMVDNTVTKQRLGDYSGVCFGLGMQNFNNSKRNKTNSKFVQYHNTQKVDNSFTPVKLFVNRVPKWMRNEDLMKIFSKYGVVVECNIIRDSNGPKGCAFVRFATIVEAQNAILCIHGKTVLNEEAGPIQVKYADGEIERLGLSPDVQPCGESVKVFVGCLPKTCTEAELLTLFRRFGHVDEVHIIRDDNRQSKCSAFVTFPKRYMAENAIVFLDKKYILDNGKRPIEVRLARSRSKQKQLSSNHSNVRRTNDPKLTNTNPNNNTNGYNILNNSGNYSNKSGRMQSMNNYQFTSQLNYQHSMDFMLDNTINEVGTQLEDNPQSNDFIASVNSSLHDNNGNNSNNQVKTKDASDGVPQFVPPTFLDFWNKPTVQV
ncbi:RNA recognition family protein [Cryptosporidium andersoni]|uniref:RNA recognition family protein n=1 Tax=Cryptosporidium andersoni TaxID=117008 RepID=A0A1J4MQX9_9CRYT|nr:RNA recognition family protein [Cryptosporidium andersoni]